MVLCQPVLVEDLCYLQYLGSNNPASVLDHKMDLNTRPVEY